MNKFLKYIVNKNIKPDTIAGSGSPGYLLGRLRKEECRNPGVWGQPSETHSLKKIVAKYCVQYDQISLKQNKQYNIVQIRIFIYSCI